ncbi:MAG: VTT domain-containing protein [Candidatus Omnitrophica bacterium]|nr:VTT domain-containing protein [Candidatus Omnitrophota bacterium]
MKKYIIRIGLIGVVLVFLIFLTIFFLKDIEKIYFYLKKIPFWISTVSFVILYVIANFVVFFDAKDLLKPIGALIFGAYLSTLLIYIAEIINAYIFFKIARKFGKNYVEKILKGKFKNFYENVSNINFGWLFLLRLLPLIPYRVLDLGFGLTKMSFKKYLPVVLFASPPRIFWIQFILASVGGFYPKKIMQFYTQQPLISIAVFLYFIISLIIAFLLRNKFK